VTVAALAIRNANKEWELLMIQNLIFFSGMLLISFLIAAVIARLRLTISARQIFSIFIIAFAATAISVGMIVAFGLNQFRWLVAMLIGVGVMDVWIGIVALFSGRLKNDLGPG
jgi:hypothetical protein